MRFAESSEQREFAASLCGLLDRADVPAVTRSWSHGDYATGRKLWSRLAESGVTALAMPEQHGGFGAHPVDLVIAFEVLGRFAVPGPWVESVAVLPALLAGTAAADRLSAMAAGELIATVATPPSVPFALDAGAADAVFLVDGDRLSAAPVTDEARSVDRARRLAAVSAVVPDRACRRAASP